jgi:hypothetical protein
MNAFTNYLEKMGSNFLVAAMVPSLAFIIASVLVFDSVLHVAIAFRNPEGIYRLVGFSLFLFIFTVIIGFTLTALNTYILKMFEGYVIFPPISFLYKKSWKIHKQNAHSLMLHRDRLEHRIRYLEDQGDLTVKQKIEMEELIEKHYQATSDYNLSYPEDLNDILPTSFGNRLKAAENYSGERYGFDGVQFWPRLVEVIPVEYKLSIDSVRNELSFLVNMSILSSIFFFLCVIAIFISLFNFTVTSSGPVVFIEAFSKTATYLLAAALGFLSADLFYKASILSVSSFGLMIRSSCDLFRKDLLKKFELNRPRDSVEEFDTWQKWNELIVLGSHSLTFKKIDYRTEEKKQ